MSEEKEEKSECCFSCLVEKEEGYGDDIEGCCCKHAIEAIKKESKNH